MKKVGLAILVGAVVATGAIVVPDATTARAASRASAPTTAPTTPSRSRTTRRSATTGRTDPNCGGFYNDYIACFQSNQTCTSTGVTDYTITDGICGAQYATWVNCYYGTDGGGFADAAGE